MICIVDVGRIGCTHTHVLNLTVRCPCAPNMFVRSRKSGYNHIPADGTNLCGFIGSCGTGNVGCFGRGLSAGTLLPVAGCILGIIAPSMCVNSNLTGTRVSGNTYAFPITHTGDRSIYSVYAVCIIGYFERSHSQCAYRYGIRVGKDYFTGGRVRDNAAGKIRGFECNQLKSRICAHLEFRVGNPFCEPTEGNGNRHRTTGICRCTGDTHRCTACGNSRRRHERKHHHSCKQDA